MGTGRADHTAALLLDGRVLAAGGFNNSYLSSAELYDPTDGTWTATGSMGTPRQSATATSLLSGEVLVVAGYNSGIYPSSAELYDPATGRWSSTGSMSNQRFLHTATLLPSGKALVAGGRDGGFNFLSSAELYDPSTGSWSNTGNLGTARAYHTATLLPSGEVLAAGGSSSAYLSSAELYGPGLTLSVRRRRVEGINTARLAWAGAHSANIDVYRDVAPPIATIPNTGSYIDSTGDTGQANYKYRVCEAGTSTCSNRVKVVFPP